MEKWDRPWYAIDGTEVRFIRALSEYDFLCNVPGPGLADELRCLLDELCERSGGHLLSFAASVQRPILVTGVFLASILQNPSGMSCRSRGRSWEVTSRPRQFRSDLQCGSVVGSLNSVAKPETTNGYGCTQRGGCASCWCCSASVASCQMKLSGSSGRMAKKAALTQTVAVCGVHTL